ncbi:hypothetical protein V8E53_000322, partial [Lactarius tabidus]
SDSENYLTFDHLVQHYYSPTLESSLSALRSAPEPPSFSRTHSKDGLHESNLYIPEYWRETKGDAASNMLGPASLAAPDNVSARMSRSGVIVIGPEDHRALAGRKPRWATPFPCSSGPASPYDTLLATRRPITSLRDYRGVETSPRTPRRSIGRPSSCGPVTQVDNIIYVLVQVRMLHDPPHSSLCAATAGIMFACHLEAAGRATQVQIWSLARTTPDPSTWGTKWDSDSRPRNEAYLSNFNARPDNGPLLHSTVFACPPPSPSLKTFEVSCVGRDGEDDDDGRTQAVW